MKDKLKKIREEAVRQIEESKELNSLNDVRVAILGKKGELTAVLKGMKDVKPEDRPMVGQLVNETREAIEQKLEETKEQFVHVTRGVDNSREETEMIQSRTEVCDTSREKVIDVIANLSAISQENAASTQETTASMSELNETIRILAEAAGNLRKLSDDLDEEMKFFKL